MAQGRWDLFQSRFSKQCCTLRSPGGPGVSGAEGVQTLPELCGCPPHGLETRGSLTSERRPSSLLIGGRRSSVPTLWGGSPAWHTPSLLFLHCAHPARHPVELCWGWMSPRPRTSATGGRRFASAVPACPSSWVRHCPVQHGQTWCLRNRGQPGGCPANQEVPLPSRVCRGDAV